ncbi:MAG: HlyC/CorC family transporter [Anaerolineae bacterium]|nr:HlyC/CorC family transporter [Anaerolineae bacterium]
MSSTVWVIFAILVCADLAFALVRASLIKARLPVLVTLQDKTPGAIERTLALMERPTLRTTLRSASVMVHFLLGGTFLLVFERLTNRAADPLLALGITLLLAIVVLMLEFWIESFVSQDAEKWAVQITPLAIVVDFISRPLGWIFRILQFSSPDMQRTLGSVTEDELKSWAESEQVESTLEKGERKMIYSIFHFSDTLCREIMVPRIDVFALEVGTPLDEAIRLVNQSGHSRVPVYEEVIDNVIGMLYAKDLLSVKLDCEASTDIRSIMRPAYFVPEAKKVDELLREIQANGIHIAVVIDEYGGMAGLVTLEDIVEEIVGEIRDEYDQAEELPFTKLSEDEYLLQARIDLDDLNELLGTEVSKDTAETLGGLIYSELGHIPEEGEQVILEDWVFSVQQVSGRRIRLVRAARLSVDQTENRK